MHTEFRTLELLEDDLRDAAARERVGAEGRGASGKPRKGRPGRWLAVAAAMLVVAGVVGKVATQNGVGTTAGEPFGFRAPSALAAGGREAQNLPGVTTAPAPGTQADQLGQAGDAAPSASPAPGHIVAGAGGAASPPQADLTKIIRNGSITLVVPDKGFQTGSDAVTAIAQQAGGMVLTSTQAGGSSGTFTLRIPAQRFDGVMTKLEHLGIVDRETRTGKDVTAQFIDLKARLHILRAELQATMTLLHNASTLSDTIRFQNQAFNIQGQIESQQGQLNYLTNQVAESTVNVSMREKSTPETQQKPAPVKKPSLVRAWDQAVSGFLGVLAAVIVGLGYLIPLGVLALVAWLVVMAVRRRRRGAS